MPRLVLNIDWRWLKWWTHATCAAISGPSCSTKVKTTSTLEDQWTKKDCWKDGERRVQHPLRHLQIISDSYDSYPVIISLPDLYLLRFPSCIDEAKSCRGPQWTARRSASSSWEGRFTLRHWDGVQEQLDMSLIGCQFVPSLEMQNGQNGSRYLKCNQRVPGSSLRIWQGSAVLYCTALMSELTAGPST